MAALPKLECSYSTISSTALLTKVIPDYSINDVTGCVFWERGSTDTYVVRCANARYSLRIYRKKNHTREEVDFEVDALNFLHTNGFPVAYPIARRSGGYITEILAPEGVRYVLVSAFAQGDEADYDTLEDFCLTGKSVAELHNVSDEFKTPHKRVELDLALFTEERFDSIVPHISHRPNDLAFLSDCIQFSRESIATVGVESLDYGFIHGDVHGGNCHLHEGVLTHFDFEECGFGFRVFDMATFKWACCEGEKGGERWAAFVEGYKTIRTINDADLQLVDTFVLLRHIWLIAFHMRNAEDFGGELLSDGYIDHQWKKLKSLRSATLCR